MADYCDGTVWCDDIHEQYVCQTICGCFWEFGTCGGEEDCWGLGKYDCLDCPGCEWIEEPEWDMIKINIADVFKNAEEVKMNYGDAWKTITQLKINVGDVWKTVYQA